MFLCIFLSQKQYDSGHKICLLHENSNNIVEIFFYFKGPIIYILFLCIILSQKQYHSGQYIGLLHVNSNDNSVALGLGYGHTFKKNGQLV